MRFLREDRPTKSEVYAHRIASAIHPFNSERDPIGSASLQAAASKLEVTARLSLSRNATLSEVVHPTAARTRIPRAHRAQTSWASPMVLSLTKDTVPSATSAVSAINVCDFDRK